MSRASPDKLAKLGVAHVPEGRGILTELTVHENLRMGAYVRRDRQVRADIDRVAEHFPWLTDRREQEAGTLSGGEQQMLALARALVAKPKLLMLDEPSLGLAPMVVQELFRVVRQLNDEEGLTVLVVEQNANIALDVSRRAYVLEVGRVAVEGESRELRRARGNPTVVPGVLVGVPLFFQWSEFVQQLVFGTAIGAVYGSLGLAIVLIYRTTRVVNFAQGEMAMFTTFICWSLTTNHGFSFWPAFFVTIVIAFLIGVVVERVAIRPFGHASPLTLILVTIALFVIFSGLAAWIWSR